MTAEIETALADVVSQHRVVAEAICTRLTLEIAKLGFPDPASLQYPHYDQASYVLTKDPYTGHHNLSCYWYGNNQRIGRLQFNSDGSFYAEFDVAKIHPGKPHHFVESVTAWGNPQNIKAEAKLLLLPT